MVDILESIQNDDVENVAYLISNGCDYHVNDCIQLSLLNGSVMVSRLIWTRYTPFLTIRTLMDIERNMSHARSHKCIDFICILIQRMKCSHEAAHNTLYTNMNY